MVLVRCPHSGTTMRAAVTSWLMTDKKKEIKILSKQHTLKQRNTQSQSGVCMDKLTHKGQIYIKCTHFIWAKHET